MRGFAELVLRSELIAGSRQVLDAPPEFAARRSVDLASVVLAVGARVDVDEDDFVRGVPVRLHSSYAIRPAPLPVLEGGV